jgi:hypothetical protein
MKKIVQGWANLARFHTGDLDPEIENMAAERLEKCEDCPARRLFFCSILVRVPHAEDERLVRGCGCMITPKVLSPDSSCPAGHW